MALFGLAYDVMIRPLPFADPDRLVAIWGDASYRGVDRSEVAPAEFRYLEQQAATLADMALYSYSEGLTLLDSTGSRIVRNQPVAANMFDLLGVQPMIGRSFFLDEPSTDAVALASHSFWQNHFGGQTDLHPASDQS